MLALKQKYIECVVIRTDCLDHLHNKTSRTKNGGNSLNEIPYSFEIGMKY